ncbi:hypothetical protein [Kitasatospora sp. NPDC093558]|uniref:hypothetical protein n=1 Tax=Kitasatospora sp. NPDC093558 TaxID=3155201 RepID=UPI003423602B
MTDPQRRLSVALDALDAAVAPFAEQPFTSGGCGHCHSDEDLAALAGPARLVPEDLLALVAIETPGHWDDFPGLYRRLAPRIVRGVIAGTLPVDHAWIASWLVRARWQDWPAAERTALDAVWSAWWTAVLAEHPGTVRSATVALETVAVATGGLGRWLDEWTRTRTGPADRHLDDAVDEWLFEWQLADLRFGFLDEVHATPELMPWLLSLAPGRVGAGALKEIEEIARG